MTRKSFGRGMGSLYHQPQSRIWWVQYRAHGKTIRESTGTDNDKAARDFLKERLGPRPVSSAEAKRVTLSDLLGQVLTDYRVNGKRSLPKAERNVKQLRDFFGEIKAQDVTTARIRDFIAHRQGAKRKKISNATINRELACLKRAYSLAVREERLDRRPYVPMLAEQNVRKGFFEDAELAKVLSHLPPPIDAITQFGAITGWRKSEIIGLTWDRVDVAAGLVRLDPGTTKNGEGREFPAGAHPTLAALLKQRREATDAVEAAAMERGVTVRVPWVFCWPDGTQVRDFRGAWARACRLAECPGRLFHDLRRTAVRNLERAGVPRSHAMQLTGHKTEAVYRRYAISAKRDLAQAVAQLAALLQNN
ncbi:MAG: tyrosine-type recombinase/integrase [Nitrospirota bacterium]